MMPFTTYTIPETAVNKTAPAEKWLLFIAELPFSSEQIEFIQKIGTALKADFDLDSFCWNKNQNPNVSIQDITSASTQLVISFGIAPAHLGLWIDLQTPGIRFLESFTFILTLPVAELEKSAAAKKELWRNMQMFMEMNEKKHA